MLWDCHTVKKIFPYFIGYEVTKPKFSPEVVSIKFKHMINFTLSNGIEVPYLYFGPGMFTRGLKFESSLLGKVRNWYKYRKHEQNYYKAI